MTELLSGRLKARIAAGETIGLVWLSLGHASVAEIAARSGADALVLDLQHGLWDRMSVEMAVGLALATTPVIARVQDNSTVAIGQALDAGAEGVLVPMVETAEQAAQAVSAARFPPHGHRSGGGVRPLSSGFGSYLQKAGAITVGVMVETRAGVEAIAAIAAVPGLDYVLIGTGDLGISYAAADAAPEAAEAGCARVLAACAEAGIPCGIFTRNAAEAIERRKEGYRFVVLANDIDALGTAFSEATRSFASPA